MIKLAVIPTTAVGLFELQDRDCELGRERRDLSTKPVADRPQQRWRRDLIAPASAQQPHDLTADLQVGDIGVEVQPVDTLDLERHIALEHVIDVHHARHMRSMTPPGPALPDRHPSPCEGRPRGGPAPLPLMPRLGSDRD
jgi:hypothetical protein